MVSGPQILIILALVAVVFVAPKRLPGLGKSLGDAIRGFKKGISGEDDNEIDVTASAQEKLSENAPEETTTKAKETEKA